MPIGCSRSASAGNPAARPKRRQSTTRVRRESGKAGGHSPAEPLEPLDLELPGSLRRTFSSPTPGCPTEIRQTAFDLGRRGGRQRSCRRDEIEERPTARDTRRSRRRRGAVRLPGERSRHPDERDQQQGFRPRERGQPEQQARSSRRARPCGTGGRRDEQRGQRHLHARQRPPDGGPAMASTTPTSSASRRDRPSIARRGERARNAVAERRGDADQLGPVRVAARRERESGREHQRPEGRRRAADGDAGVVGETVPLGEIAREVQDGSTSRRGERTSTRACPATAPLRDPEETERGASAAATTARSTGGRARFGPALTGRGSPAVTDQRVAGVLHGPSRERQDVQITAVGQLRSRADPAAAPAPDPSDPRTRRAASRRAAA